MKRGGRWGRLREEVREHGGGLAALRPNRSQEVMPLPGGRLRAVPAGVMMAAELDAQDARDDVLEAVYQADASGNVKRARYLMAWAHSIGPAI